MNKLKVLSLFDGISGAKQALNDLGIESEYYASEVDKYAIQISKANHPGIVQMEDVKFLEVENNYLFYNQNNDPMKNGGSVKCDFDLLIGGSPCQNLSIAGNGEGLKGDKSSLFYEYVRILKQTKPKYFVLENVNSMKKADKETITEELFGIEPVMINSALVTAQQRKRLYWVGKLIDGKYEQVKIEQPEDKAIFLKDILEDLDDDVVGCAARGRYKNGKVVQKIETRKDNKANCLTTVGKDSMFIVRDKSNCLRVGGRSSPFGSKQIWDSPFQIISKKTVVKNGIEKSPCLTGGGNSGGNHSDMDLIHSPIATRRYSPTECERLQGFPNEYTNFVSNTQRYKGLGNSFTVPVIKHILKSIF